MMEDPIGFIPELDLTPEEQEAERRLAEKVSEIDRRKSIEIALNMLGELRAQGVVTLAGKGGAVETLKGML